MGKRGGKGVAIMHHSALLATLHPDPSWKVGKRKGYQEVGSMEVGSTHKKGEKREVVWVARKEAREVRETVGRRIPLSEGNHKIGRRSGWGMERVKEGDGDPSPLPPSSRTLHSWPYSNHILLGKRGKGWSGEQGRGGPLLERRMTRWEEMVRRASPQPSQTKADTRRSQP